MDRDYWYIKTFYNKMSNKMHFTLLYLELGNCKLKQFPPLDQ